MDAETFKRIRQRLKLTQDELAHALGAHRVSVANWEGGRKPISPTIARLMECLDRERKARPGKR